MYMFEDNQIPFADYIKQKYYTPIENIDQNIEDLKQKLNEVYIFKAKEYIEKRAQYGVPEISIHFGEEPKHTIRNSLEKCKKYEQFRMPLDSKEVIVAFLLREKFKIDVWHEHVAIYLAGG